MFYSTRNSSLSLYFSEALLEGLSPDGGLFLPDKIAVIDPQKLLGKSYQEMAFAILRPYLDDFTDEEIRYAVSSAYSKNNFPERIVNVDSFGSVSFLELFHGQTLTFKDMALSLLPFLMETALKKHPERNKIHILTATSGDTGSAVLSSFRSAENIDVSVLYPEGGIATLQERQMLSFTSKAGRAYALKASNFDDCQRLVKKLLIEKEGQGYSSANSINIGRLLPQIVYYYYAYLALVRDGKIGYGEKIDVIVPTGNFGDIFACYLAKRMSLPLGRLIVASNENKVLTDFFATGIYDANRPFVKTNSPSMDILVSSNLERLLSLVIGDDAKLRALEKSLAKKGRFEVDEETLIKLQFDFLGFSSTEEETTKAISKCYLDNDYLIDPHTAVAYAAYEKYRRQGSQSVCLVVATASPLKFPEVEAKALSMASDDGLVALPLVASKACLTIPSQLQKALSSPACRYSVDEKEFRSILSRKGSVTISSPASTANVGPGFDRFGIALSLFNTLRFERSKDDVLSGFVGEEETKNNLVQKAYRAFFAEYGLPYQSVKITLVKCDIPLSRGLGSSASCIVAGLLAANEFSGHFLAKEKLLDLAAKIEGHPDNVAPCLLGGFRDSKKDESGAVKSLSMGLCRDIGFLLLIPEQELSTSLARSVLPKSYSLDDQQFNAAQIVSLVPALQNGDIKTIASAIVDRYHVPYRLPLIKGAEAVEKIAEKHHLPFTISGAGSSLLVLYSEKNKDSVFDFILDVKKNVSVRFGFMKLEASYEGASIKED